ncbi:NAD(P)/FAD-dependent oxidoreductase [Thalassotalea marina]|uniref:Ferredoxin--NADP reductase n=1 Tax=Thalassotalea marina TaxID=1673741 RepID=A0A919BCA5_9GAMM|nr:NAD(P)/FAD-dependent oxidoreductase [Thalassotalea marina]GHF79053.1 ferredoxin--NADP reductase [Thalassotalea marina]
MSTNNQVLHTDVAIIGAGPVGLFQIFELGLHDLSAIVIDGLPYVGGQCTSLYPEKPIYDIPALVGATGRTTIDNLIEQCKPFKPTYLLENKVHTLIKNSVGSFTLVTDKNNTIHCNSVVIATGAGAFEPVKLKVNGIEQFEAKQLFYHVKDPAMFSDQDLVILGGGDSAFDWVENLLPIANSIVLIHRSLNFRATSASISKMHANCDALKMQFLCGQVIDFKESNHRLTAIVVQSKDGVKRVVSLDSLLVFFGLNPKPGPVEQWGLKMHNRSIVVDTANFESSVEGIYAVGDVNYYQGKRKLILSGFHEAALAAFSIKQTLSGEQHVATIYTTTNQKIVERLK